MSLFANSVLVRIAVAMVPIIVLVIVLAIGTLYIFTLYKCLKLINPKNRALPPWSAWLLCIPIFSFLWNYILIFKMAKSWHSENRQRTIKIQKIETGRDVGFVYTSVSLLCTLISQQKVFLALFAGMFWVGHWIIVGQQIKQLRGAAGAIASVPEIDLSSPNQAGLE